MPTLRFTRDKRGYENTYVVHSPKRQGRGRVRVLYWFRTPPGVRVGREPLDEDAIRLIEEHNPAIRFDWPQILKGEDERPAEAKTTQAAYAEPAREPSSPAQTESPVNPAHGELGAEGLTRLRVRYAHVIAAITQRVTDPQRQDEFRLQAERLNPDRWVTPDEVKAGLDRYEAVLEALRSVIGRRRRRRKTRSERAPETEPAVDDEVMEGDGGGEPPPELQDESKGPSHD